MTSRAATSGNPGAAVLVPLVEGEGGLEIVFEVRAQHLKHQPGEVCLPGGMAEQGEAPWQTAVRETSEELSVDPDSIRLVERMPDMDGPRGNRIAVFVGMLNGYGGTYCPSEVDRTFTMPLDWFVAHRPTVYPLQTVLDPSGGFPWDLIPGGRSYPFHKPMEDIVAYPETDPFIWGFTARVMQSVSEALRG